jgi:tetratricopeptide (TPR) repeat protein
MCRLRKRLRHAAMKRQRLVSQGTLARLFRQAAEAWRRQDYQETLDLLERARRFDPGNPAVLFDLGRAYGLRYDYAAAERCLDSAVRLSPRPAEALGEAGRRCQEFGHYEMATRYFERAVAQPVVAADALVTLAELYERGPRSSEAVVLIERALQLQSRHARARLAQARSRRLAGQVEEAERLTRSLLDEAACEPQIRIRAWYELGANLDRQERFDDAINAWLEAKALQRPLAAKAAEVLHGVQARVQELERTITTGVLERWSDAREALGPSRQLTVLCGHPRSGTTLLEQVLDAHPQIISAEETHILHDEAYLPLCRGFPESASVLQVLDAAAPSQLRQARASYFHFTELFLRQPIAGRWLIDKNPALNVLIPAVLRLFPEAKFLVALRDPRDVCLSCFMQYLPLNPVASAYLTLEGAARQYASVMGLWRALWPRLKNPWIEARYEEMVVDLEAVARRVLAFLDLPWDDAVLRFHEHARQKPVRSPTYADVSKPIYRSAVGRWRHYQKYLEPHLESLAPFVEALGYEH